VIGIDVHPVAVHLARATWTLAARDALEGAVAEGQSVNATVPVYLGDSLQLRAETSGMFAQQTVTIPVPDPPDSDVEFNRELEFPRALVEQADWFDNLMTRMANAIENGEDPAWALDDEAIGSGSDREMLEKTAALLQQLHEEGRDHIWAYYTRNLVRPVALRADPVDVIVGNPPWITYNKTQAVVREELERQSKERYTIWAGGRYATQQDIAGMFFARCVELYLKPGRRAAMVLPHSTLQTGQYKKWRTGEWGVLSVDLSVREPWDLELIEPNDFFPVPACVAFVVRRDPPAKPLSSQADRWRGPVGGPYTRDQVALTDTSGEFASPYGDRTRNGATIYPRPLFFVEVQQSTALVQAAKTVTVSPRRSKQEKSPWKTLHLPQLAGQVIEVEHVFDVHVGETVAPFVLLDPLTAVLPLSKVTGELAKDEQGWYGIDPLTLGERMRRRWRAVNQVWEANKGRNSSLSLVGNLDYVNKLSYQRAAAADEIRLLYSANGRPTSAVLNDNSALIDNALMWIPCSSDNEAQYLMTLINSQSLWDASSRFMSRGQFGGRNMKKLVWHLPIPEYDDSDPLHIELAEAGEAAANGAKALWDGVRVEREGRGQSTSVTVARREIRKWLSESAEGRRVEGLVSRLLGG
jgi:hypothetical protein